MQALDISPTHNGESSAFRDSHLSVYKNFAIMTRSAATVNNSKGRSRFFAILAFVFFIIVAAVLLHRHRMLSRESA